MIGTVTDNPWERNDEIHEVFITEITDLLSCDFELRFPGDKMVEEAPVAAREIKHYEA